MSRHLIDDDPLATIEATPYCRKHSGNVIVEGVVRRYWDDCDCIPKAKPPTPKTEGFTEAVEQWLNALFDSGVEVGGDIVLERQFENDPEAYKRYRARATKEVLETVAALKDAEVERVTVTMMITLETERPN